MSDPVQILVVDDDHMMQDFAVRILASLGYSCTTAFNAESALNLLEQNPHIKVLFTDIHLGAGMDGAQLARRARAMHPGLGVLVTSGASGCPLQRDMPDDIAFLPRPYRRGDLAARLSAML